MQEFVHLQIIIIRTESCTQATDMKKEYTILFETYFNENGFEIRKKW